MQYKYENPQQNLSPSPTPLHAKPNRISSPPSHETSAARNSPPASFANSICLTTSSLVTVGRAPCTARIKSLYVLLTLIQRTATDERSGKTRNAQRWFEQLFGRDVGPGLLHCSGVARRARRHLHHRRWGVGIGDGDLDLRVPPQLPSSTTARTEDERTDLKCVALRTLRTGCINASRTTTAMSDPEYPSVFAASWRYSGWVRVQGVVPTLSSNMRFRASGSGRGM